jgi:hypothetical protein
MNRRRTIDLAVSGAGVVIAVVLIVFGVYFSDRYSFAENNVKDQLSEQKVFFPEKDALTDEELEQPGVVRFAGQLVDDGEKAEVYANQLIALHLEAIADGKTSAALGGPQFALRDQIAAAEESNDPDLPELQAQLDEVTGQRDTLFKGETLRGLLLTTYGFWQFGQEAQLAMIVSFVAAGLLLVLAALGVVHAMRAAKNA